MNRATRRVVTRRNSLVDLVTEKKITGNAAAAAIQLAKDFEKRQASPPGLVKAEGMTARGNGASGRPWPGCTAHDRIEDLRRFLPPALRTLLSEIWTAEVGRLPILDALKIETGYKHGTDQHRACVLGHIQALMEAAWDYYAPNERRSAA